MSDTLTEESRLVENGVEEVGNNEINDGMKVDSEECLNVRFTAQDCLSYLCTKTSNSINAGHVLTLFSYFKKRQVEDPMFFYSMQVDEQCRITNFFWRDAQSRLDYEFFGDVVVFDTTYRTKYNMVCAPFAGINHHRRSVVFGCAFLLDETVDSFVWLFETFLESMGNRPPKTIFTVLTDQCQAMSNAMAKVFPETRHRLCSWDISKKARQKFRSRFAKTEFKSQFEKCLYWCRDIMEFETTWKNMIQGSNLVENEWLKNLYELREKWCTTFSLDAFSSSMRSTQGSEITKKVYNYMLSKTMNLFDCLLHYEDQANKMREDELKEDFNCFQCVTPRTVDCDILEHAAQVYTMKMFWVFELEFFNTLGVKMNLLDSGGVVNTYQLIESGNERVHIVQHNILDCTFSCGCKMFETMGILCRHCLKVLHSQDITRIPAQYILRRWTREPKKRRSNDCGEPLRNNLKSSKTMHHSKLFHVADSIMHRILETIERTKIAEQTLVRTEQQLDQIERRTASLKEVDDSDESEGESEGDDTAMSCSDETYHSLSLDETRVLDPLCVRQEGTRNAELKSNLEKKRKTTSKGSTTSRTSHPNMFGKNNQAPVFDPSCSPFHDPHQLFPTIGMPATNACTIQPPLNFQFTRMLQSSDHNPCLSQTSSTSSNAELISPSDGKSAPK